MEEFNVTDWLFEIVSKELKKESFKEDVLRPLVKSLISYILPYLFFVMGINLVMIVFALTVVFYFIPKK